MPKNLLIIFCSLWLAACGISSKEKEAKTISWGTQVAQKLDSVYKKEEPVLELWFAKTEKMKTFFATSQEKKQNYPTNIKGLSGKINLYRNLHIVFYTDSLWKIANIPFLPLVSTTEKNIYTKKYQKNWDSTLFLSIFKGQEDIEKNVADVQNWINESKNIYYIAVYKTVAFKAPKITNLGFEKGILEVQTFLYNLDTQTVLLQFSLKTENLNFETFQTQKPAQQEERLTELLYQQIEQKIQDYLNTCCK